MKLIEQIFYLDKLKDVMETADIKVITGVRRSGKSKLLEAFMEYVRQVDTTANIIHVNYSLSEYEPLLEYHKLNAYVEKAYQAEKTNYIFIDEVQMCEGFEKAINNFHLGSSFLNRFSLYQDYYFLTIHQLLEVLSLIHTNYSPADFYRSIILLCCLWNCSICCIKNSDSFLSAMIFTPINLFSFFSRNP